MEIFTHKNYLFVCAHYDDEGDCTHLMRESMRKGSNVFVVYITDCNAKKIGVIRKREVTEALDVIGVPHENRFFLDIPERTVFQNFALVVNRLEKITQDHFIDCVLSTDYEGGHEDHDSAAFCASMLAQKYKIDQYTYPSYHSANGTRSLVKEFIPSRTNVIRLEVTEPEIKKRMSTIYKSQKLSTDKLGDSAKQLAIHSRELYYEVEEPFDFSKRPWHEIAYENHPTPYFTFEDFLKAVEKYKRDMDRQRMSSDVNIFLEQELSTNVKLTQQIKEACLRLQIDFKEFRKSVYDYAMFFADTKRSNDIYNEVATSLAIYFCAHMRNSFNRTRHQTTFQWLKQINPNSITDCGYAVPTDYMLDKEFILGRKINLVEASEFGQKVSEAFFDINGVPTENISFNLKDMNDFEYVGDSDAYVFLDSIEHVSNPDKYLKVQVDNAKNGAYFIFSIPICKIDSLKNFHYKEWLTDDSAKKWVEENGLRVMATKLAFPNPSVDIFSRPILGGFHNILILCQKKGDL